jgi:hypothetical protein
MAPRWRYFVASGVLIVGAALVVVDLHQFESKSQPGRAPAIHLGQGDGQRTRKVRAIKAVIASVERENLRLKSPVEVGIDANSSGLPAYDRDLRSITFTRLGMELSESSIQFVLLHEFAHAIIDDEQGIALGSEEVAADDFAVYWLVTKMGNAQEGPSDVTDVFSILAEDSSPDYPSPSWRVRRIRCLLLGASSDQPRVNEVRDFVMCRALYADVARGWDTLLTSRNSSVSKH